MLGLFLLTTYLLFGGRVFQQAVGIFEGDVATYKWEVCNGNIEIISFVVKCRFWPAPHCQFRGVG
jgi:hypothetical protein